MKKNKKLVKTLIIIMAIAGIIILARIFNLGEKFEIMQQWIKTLGFFAPMVFSLIYIIAVVSAIPGSALTVGAGAIFGSVEGVIIVSISSTIGASLSFLAARYLMRDTISKWLSKNEKFIKLDNLTKKHGAIIVAITRLVPIFPFNLLNYGFGLTKVKFSTYVLWSWICMLPGTILYVVGADAFSKSISAGEIPWKLVLVIVVSFIMILFFAKKAKKKLKGGSNE